MKKAVLINFAIFKRVRPAALLRTDCNTGVFSKYFKIFKNTFFEEQLLTAASDFLKQLTYKQVMNN